MAVVAKVRIQVNVLEEDELNKNLLGLKKRTDVTINIDNERKLISLLIKESVYIC